MARIGIIIVIGVIIISMAAAMYMYTQYKTNFITANAGEVVVVGPVEYITIFDGTDKGSKEMTPENTFVKIKITAKNTGIERTWITKEQFYLVDEKQQKYKLIHTGIFTDELSDFWLEPNKPAIFTIYFDVPYDESKKYNVIVRPSKQQSSSDIASICITNC